MSERGSISSDIDEVEIIPDNIEFEDQRLRFFLNYLNIVYGTTPTAFKKAILNNEINRQIFQTFLDKSDRNIILIFENSDTLNLFNEFPLEFKSKIICFIKRYETIIEKDIPLKKQLIIAEFTHSSITQFSLFISEILWPILQRRKIISNWPDIIIRNCIQNISELTNLLSIINGILRGRTILSIPNEIEFLSRSDYLRVLNHNKTFDNRKIRLLENLIITWKNQIQTAIIYDRNSPKNNSYLLPNIEIQFWITRAENLQGIKTQIHSQLIRRLVEILEVSGSNYFSTFRTIFRDVIQALDEAQNIALYLKSLIPILEIIENVQDIQLISRYFHRLFHTLALIWVNSVYYTNISRFIGFLQQWTNLVILKIRDLLQPNDLFVDTDFDESIQLINLAIETCLIYKTSYQNCKTSLPSYFNDRQIRYWEIPESKIFERFDHFVDRLKMLKDIILTAQECSIYESIELGGIDADELQSILQKVIGDFKSAYAVFRDLSDDITNDSNLEFPNAYKKFRKIVLTGDERIANILRRFLQPCNNNIKTTNIDTIYRLLRIFGSTLQRNRLKYVIDQYTNTFLNIIENALNEDEILFDEYIKDSHSVWLLSMSKFISDHRWIEQLRQRINNQIEPLKIFDINNDIYKQILEKEKNLQKKLDYFIENINKQWINSFKKDNLLHLNEPLLRKEDKYYIVNIKSEFMTALHEIMRLYQIPNFILSSETEEFYQQIDRFQQQFIDLDYITKSYRHIYDNILIIEYPLIREELTEIENDLEKASTIITLNIDTDSTDFIHHLRTIINDFEERLFKSKTNLDDIQKILKHFIKPALYSRADTRQDPLLIVYEKEDKVLKRNNELRDAGLHLQDILKQNKWLLKADANSDIWKGYVDYVDEIIIESLYEIIEYNLNYLLEESDPILNKRPLFEVQLILDDLDLRFNPTLEFGSVNSLYDIVDTLIGNIFRQAAMLPRLAEHSGQKHYQNDLEEMKELNNNRLKIMERLRETMKEANDWKEEIEENSYLWLDDRKEHMRQFLLYGRSLEDHELENHEYIKETPPNLIQFQNQIDLFQSIYNDIDNWDQTFIFNSWLRVDARPIKRQLLILVTKWIDLYKNYLIDHITISLNELQLFIKYALDMFQHQIKSNDLKNLIEMMTFLKQVNARQEYTDDMSEPIKDIIELLKSYAYEVPQNIYSMLDELPEQWIMIKKMAIQMKQYIAPLQANQVINIRNQILDMDKKQQELRERFLRDAPFKYNTTEPYIENGVTIINVEQLLHEAIEAFNNNELNDEETDDNNMEYSTKIDHDNIPISNGNTTIDQTGTNGDEYSSGPHPILDDLTDPTNIESLNNKKNKMDKLSDRAKIGSIIIQSMKLGESLSDRMAVQLIIERLHRIPEGEGWIIDGFPTTYDQVKLLENALAGYEEEHKKDFDPLLAPNPRPPPPPEPYKSIIDLVVLFHVTNDMVIRRAAGRSFAPLANREYHEQYNPPPPGAATGFNGQEQVFSTKDAANDMEQLQHRITQFQDSYPRIEKFYSQYSKVVVVDETISNTPLDEEQLYHELSRAIETHVNEEQAKIRQAEEERERAENERLAKEQEEQEAKQREEDEAARVQAEAEAAAAERAAQEAAEAEAAAKKGGKGGKKDRSPVASAAKKGSPKAGGKKGKKEEEPSPAVGTTPPEPQGPPPPKPGSEEWIYVQEPIDMEIAVILSNYYDAVERNYIDTSKVVFRNIRFERSYLIDHFYTVKVNFKIYLDRPDTKQEYVDIFVKEFNALPDDARDDDEFKQELHQRVEDLSDTLHEMASKRKEEAEKEREIVMTDGWVPDHLGLLTNHYITLMQSEIDRYQDALRMIRDYYKSMQQPIPDEMKQEYARLPLFELMEGGERPASVAESLVDYDATKAPATPGVNADLDPASQAGTPKKDKRASSASKGSKRTPSPPKKGTGKKDKEVQPSADATVQSLGQDLSAKNLKPKLPLVPRRPLSAFEATDNKKRPNQATASKKRADDANAGEPSPQPPEDMDERLIFDAHRLATQYINEMLTSEQANAEIDPTASGAAPGGTAAPGGASGKDAKGGGKDAKGGGKDAKGDKKGAGGKGSAEKNSAGKGGKKGKKADEAPVENVVEATPEELAKRQLRAKIKEEYLAALSHEVRICQARLMLIRDVASRAITGLKGKADETYTRMYDWLGEKYKQETESIENMAKIIRYAIESKEKIEQQLVLDKYSFYIAEDVVVAPPPLPPPRPPPMEQTMTEQFTIDQLRELFKQFTLTAPSGLLSTKTFIDLYLDLITVTVGQRPLPEAWSNLDQIQIESLATMLSNGSEFINWRLWLVFASQPWPHPTQQELLNLLFTYAEHDTDHSGFISRSTYNGIPLWFSLERPPTPDDPSQPRPYNREHHLKQFWFDLFALDDHGTLLPYEDMLLYMAAVPHPLHGFCRALAVAERTAMPTFKEQLPHVDMHCSILNTQEYERLVEREREQAQENEAETPHDGFISVDGLHQVLHHGERKFGDTHRFATTEDPEDFASKERLYAVWDEMEVDRSSKIPLSALLNHPVIADMVANCCKYRAPDFKQILHIKQADELSGVDSHGHRTPEQTILS